MSYLPRINIIFFGSTSDSIFVLEKLFTARICAVVTQPPRPVGRHQTITPTPVETWAKERNITTLSFPSNPQKPWLYRDEAQVIDTLQPLNADVLISACYGQKIPWEAIQDARFGGLNVHPSLLPRWRGADPVPWGILSGDHQTGVTIVTLSKEFDEGRVIAQKKIPITDTDTSDALRTMLFTIGADLLVMSLPSYLSSRFDKTVLEHHFVNGKQKVPYARRLTREDGFEPWDAIQKAFYDSEEAKRIDRKFRAFTPWPGLWTRIGKTRVKILRITYHGSLLTLDTVQPEGKKPMSWKQYFSHLTGTVK